MRYLTPGFAITALRRGRQIEQFLGGIQAGERRGIRWISLSPGREGIGVHMHEVEDVGTDIFWNLAEFPPLDPDDETRGLVTVVTAPEEAIGIAEHDLGADHARWVNQGFACDEYGSYRAALQVDEPHDHGHQVVAGMSFTWTLRGHGWADCTVADSQAQAPVHVLGGHSNLTKCGMDRRAGRDRPLEPPGACLDRLRNSREL